MSLPILPKAFASVTDFGQLISVYRTECPNRWPAVRRWAITLVVLAVIGGLCYLTQSEMRRRGFETLSVAGVLLGYMGTGVVGVVGLIVFAFMFLTDWLFLGRNPQVVAVYEHGLANYDQGRIEVVDWKDIRSINEFTDNPASRFIVRYDIDYGTDRKFSVSHFIPGLNELIIQVRENVAKNQSLPGIPI